MVTNLSLMTARCSLLLNSHSMVSYVIVLVVGYLLCFVDLKEIKLSDDCECKLEPSPLVFEPFVQYQIEYLTRFRWEVYAPRFNWFYNPNLWVSDDTPCQTFKLTYSGIDVTVFDPEVAIPICTTVKNYEDLNVFRVKNCKDFKPESYGDSCRRVAYALNLMSGCGQLRTVVLSKARDEFPAGYNYRLVQNPQLTNNNKTH